VNLLLYKESVWESKIAAYMRSLDCKELQEFAHFSY